MPTNDRRDIFHPFPVEHYAASAQQVAALTAAPRVASLSAIILSIRRAFRAGRFGDRGDALRTP